MKKDSKGVLVQLVSTAPTVTGAENAAVKAGTDVTLTCGFTADTESERKWYKTAVDAANLLPDGSSVAAIPVAINADKTELAISSSTPAHGDKYICHTSDGSSQASESAYLEILTPECGVTSDGATPEKLEFSCGATYAGAWKPVLAFGETAENPTPVEDSKKVTLTGKKDVSAVSAGSVWNCKATMSLSNLDTITVDSTEDDVEVSHICTWTLGPPSGGKIESAGSHDTAVLGDTLTCSANGTPAPTYAWSNEDGTELGTNEDYVITANEVGKSLTCTATNAYDSQTVRFPEIQATTASTGATATEPPTATEITDAPVTGGSGTLKHFPSTLLLTPVLSLTMLQSM